MLLFSLFTVTPGCKIYFTTDGSRPMPFMRSINGVLKTHVYTGAFTLKYGAGSYRTVRAIAVSR